MMSRLLIILALCCTTLLSAQSIETYISNDTVLIGNDVLIKITYNNIEGSHTTPQFKDLRIISGPNTSSSVSIINGDKTSKTSYAYYLRPEREGSIVIPPLSVEHEGELIYSDTLTLTIAPNPDNLILIPEDNSERGLGSNFFEFRQFPFGERAVPKKKDEPKSKRKYKRIWCWDPSYSYYV